MNIYLLIDQSGSMARNWNETLGAVNGYVNGLASAKGLKQAKINVASFDSAGRLNFVELRRNVKIKEWIDITNKDAEPRGMTPLFDAIGRLNQWITDDAPKSATVAIITDGHENSSREIKKEDAKAMLDKLREKKFDIVFLGADFDAFGQAASVGTAAEQTLVMAEGSYAAGTKALAKRTVVYAATGNVTAWSDEDRQRAAGKNS